MSDVGALTGATVVVGDRMRASIAVRIEWPENVDPSVAYQNDRRPHVQTPLDLPKDTRLVLGRRSTRPGRRGTVWVAYDIVAPLACAGLHLTTIDNLARERLPPPSAF